VKLQWCPAIGVHLIGLDGVYAYLAAVMLCSRLVPCTNTWCLSLQNNNGSMLALDNVADQS
jgi:hypothetical protein